MLVLVFKSDYTTRRAKWNTVEPRLYDRRFKDIPDLTTNILCPDKSYSKLYGAESRGE